ncbi:hypothetical protein Acr_00g0073910 [Actinidia rufa]|uniref:DUF4057 domain-containing protein n=1 Tax=Actinidia rufa TaxID=165716 RepID=A0A7J0DS92_9ERIC|nr:hypothetical protein Acr_00g0073910 [Actinidia rufa]
MPTSTISSALDESPSTPPNAASPSFRYRFLSRVHEERENTVEGTMERNTPVRKPHTSTANLLTWSEKPATAPGARSVARSHKHFLVSIRKEQWRETLTHPPQICSPVPKILPQLPVPALTSHWMVFGGQVTDEEVESLNKR